MGDEVLEAVLDDPDKGAGQSVEFNPRLLLDALSAMPPGQVRLGVAILPSGNWGPFTVRPLDGDGRSRCA